MFSQPRKAGQEPALRTTWQPPGAGVEGLLAGWVMTRMCNLTQAGLFPGEFAPAVCWLTASGAQLHMCNLQAPLTCSIEAWEYNHPDRTFSSPPGGCSQPACAVIHPHFVCVELTWLVQVRSLFVPLVACTEETHCIVSVFFHWKVQVKIVCVPCQKLKTNKSKQSCQIKVIN